jgi:predicted nucleotidyltransferase
MTSRTVFELDKESREKYGKILQDKPLVIVSEDQLRNVRVTVARIAAMLKQTYHVEKVWVFGSLVNGTFSDSSDIDLAVEGVPSSIFYHVYADVLNYAGGRNVDLVDIDDCLPELRMAIIREGKLIR